MNAPADSLRADGVRAYLMMIGQAIEGIPDDVDVAWFIEGLQRMDTVAPLLDPTLYRVALEDGTPPLVLDFATKLRDAAASFRRLRTHVEGIREATHDRRRVALGRGHR